MKTINNALSRTLMVANFIATLLVISVHYRTAYVSTGYDYNFLVQEFLTNGIAKIAVPFFSMISGFFLVEKLHGIKAYCQLLKNKFSTLLLPYIVASALIFLSIELLRNFLINQSYNVFNFGDIFYNVLFHPTSIQFWFLRDLIVLVVISPILLKLSKALNLTLLAVLFVLWLLDIQFFPKVGGWYLISIDTVFFFCLGGMLRGGDWLDKIIQFTYSSKVYLCVFWLSLIFIRVWLDPAFNIWYARDFTLESLALHKLSILVGVVSLIQISSLNNQNLRLLHLSGLTFFAYLFHLEPLSYFRGIMYNAIGAEYSFFINFPIAVLIVFFGAHITSKHFSSFYQFISGGRSPDKVMKRVPFTSEYTRASDKHFCEVASQMSKPIISIVIPVYNGANFIKQTLDSLFSQATKDVEVILIDDGSKDNSLEVVYQNFQPYIKTKQLIVHTQSNNGVSAARNMGIEHAKGEYVGFVDADDLLLPHYIESVLEACAHKTDIVEFGFKRFIDSASELTKQSAEYSNKHFGQHAASSVIDHVYSKARWYPWTRFFKKNLFDSVRFPNEVSFCEDLMTIPYLYEKAQTIIVLKEALYGYRVNASSATYQIKNGYIKNLVSFYNAIPRTNLIRHQYLRLSTAFAILSCQTKASDNWTLPNDIQNDLFKLRRVWSIYFNVEPRKVMLLLFPKLYMGLKDVFRLIKRKPL